MFDRKYKVLRGILERKIKHYHEMYRFFRDKGDVEMANGYYNREYVLERCISEFEIELAKKSKGKES